MRIALFAPYLPAPAVTGGRIRIHRLAQGLAKHHELVLFCAAPAKEMRQAGAPEALKPYAAVYASLNHAAYLPSFLRPPSELPLRVLRSNAPSLRRAFSREHRARAFDLAVVEHSHSAWLARTEGLAFVLDEHNIESEYLREQDAARETLARKSHIQHGRLAAWERQVWKDAQQIVCVSDADAKLINPYATTPCEVVENGVDCAHTAFTPPSKRSSKTLLFVGSMRHPPNAQAALFLVEKVLPRVWERYPDARLVLCGHDPIREVLGLASSRVEVTGSVPSVEPYLRDAAIVLNPLERGAGTSLKVLEALAAGAPLVTTNVGVRGYPERIRSACHIADTPEQFSSSILNCLNTREAQDDKAKRGRLAALEFDWARLSERFESIVSGLGPG